jgi:membrane protein YdbS with pleckstrin-like domain
VGIARRQRTEFGYFDRKYGLRGLLMPMFGFFFGLLIAVAFATLFYFTGVDPNQSALVLVAIIIAFFVGVGQESLYGAR